MKKVSIWLVVMAFVSAVAMGQDRWKTIELEDEWGDPSGELAAVSSEAESGSRKRFIRVSCRHVAMIFDHLNLDGSRRNNRISMKFDPPSEPHSYAAGRGMSSGGADLLLFWNIQPDSDYKLLLRSLKTSRSVKMSFPIGTEGFSMRKLARQAKLDTGYKVFEWSLVGADEAISAVEHQCEEDN